MTREELVYELESRLLKICPSVLTHPTQVRYKGKEKTSDWSRQFCIPESETTCEFIKNIFGLKCNDWKYKYDQAVSGAGKEESKINTLHSSSLLALLCFSNVSHSNCLEIAGKVYNNVRFEVKTTCLIIRQTLMWFFKMMKPATYCFLNQSLPNTSLRITVPSQKNILIST